MGLLDAIFSRIDAAKRRAADMVANPGGLLSVGFGPEFGGAPSLRYNTEQARGLLGSVFPEVRQAGADEMRRYDREVLNPAMADILLGTISGYHGSGRDISKFSLDAPKNTGGGLNKYGVSISTDPRVASRYATDFNPDGGAVVYPVKAELDKTLNLTAQEFNRLQTLVGKMDRGEKLTESEDIGLEMLLGKAGIKPQGQHPIDAIKGAGYDSIAGDTGRFGAAEAEHLIFDPDRIRFGLLGK